MPVAHAFRAPDANCVRLQLRTSTKGESTNPVWDESLFFEAKDQTAEELNRATVEVKSCASFSGLRLHKSAVLHSSRIASPAQLGYYPYG